ncbi:hypothetical protein EIP86_003241 [Pleurotus ostreatoroseus]|nr:hypothetical protein EIP86_003241 [Pleurotus ostreatoroseus]
MADIGVDHIGSDQEKNLYENVNEVAACVMNEDPDDCTTRTESMISIGISTMSGPLAMNAQPVADGSWSSDESLLELTPQRRGSIREKLFTLGRVRCHDSECPSASSSTSTTPESSVPATPLDELPPPTVKIGTGSLGDRIGSDTGLPERKGSLSRVMRKISATIRKGSIRRKNSSARLEEVRHILEKAASDTEPSDKAEEDATDQGNTQLEDDPLKTLRLAGLFMQHLSNDSVTSLVAVHGSPTEPDCTFSESTDPSATETRPALLQAGTIILGALDLIKKLVLFVPYVVLVGLAPLLFPTHLSNITFAPAFGYVARPPTPIGCFAHHIKMLPVHIVFAVVLLTCLGARYPALALTASVVFPATTWWTWRDFDADADMTSILTCDDRLILYWIVKGVLSRDLVCPLSDLDWIDGLEDELAEEEEEEVCDLDEDEFEMLKEADGSIDCVIRVAGPGVTVHGSHMRIIVQCED